MGHIDKLNHIIDGLDETLIVSITGLRQSGKTSLAQKFATQYQGSCKHFGSEDPRSLARFTEPKIAFEV